MAIRKRSRRKMSPEEKADFFFDTILGKPKDEYGHFNLILAGQCLGEVEHYLVKESVGILKRLLRVKPDIASETVKAFKKTDPEQAVDVFAKALTHTRDEDVCREAAEALGKIGSDRAVDALISALIHTNVVVRYEAIKALTKIAPTHYLVHCLNLHSYKSFFKDYSLGSRTPFYRKNLKWFCFDQKKHTEIEIPKASISQ